MHNRGLPCLRLSHTFFFSSRRRHTRLQGDWSSDVCSSDLSVDSSFGIRGSRSKSTKSFSWCAYGSPTSSVTSSRTGRCWGPRDGGRPLGCRRSEERRGGEEGRSRWSPYH